MHVVFNGLHMVKQDDWDLPKFIDVTASVAPHEDDGDE